MEFLPNETHMADINYPSFGLIRACVDGRTNTWRMDPDPTLSLIPLTRANMVAYLERGVAWEIERRGYLPAWMPGAEIETPITYAILARNYEPEPEPYPRFLGHVDWDH